MTEKKPFPQKKQAPKIKSLDDLKKKVKEMSDSEPDEDDMPKKVKVK